MKETSIEEMHCPLQATMAVLKGKYKIYIIIIYYLMDRTLRYSELQKLMPDATPKMLSQQLKAMEKHGVIQRVLYSVVPPRTEYSLTERGKSLAPIILAMYQWGEEVFKKNTRMIFAHWKNLSGSDILWMKSDALSKKIVNIKKVHSCLPRRYAIES